MVYWPVEIVEEPRITESIEKKRVRSEFEAGYVSVRNRWTRARKKFRLVWSADQNNPMSNASKQALEEFFRDHGSDAFDWTNPIDGNTYTVIFSDDSIRFEKVRGVMMWNVEVNLEEL